MCTGAVYGLEQCVNTGAMCTGTEYGKSKTNKHLNMQISSILQCVQSRARAAACWTKQRACVAVHVDSVDPSAQVRKLFS